MTSKLLRLAVAFLNLLEPSSLWPFYTGCHVLLLHAPETPSCSAVLSTRISWVYKAAVSLRDHKDWEDVYIWNRFDTTR